MLKEMASNVLLCCRAVFILIMSLIVVPLIFLLLPVESAIKRVDLYDTNMFIYSQELKMFLEREVELLKERREKMRKAIDNKYDKILEKYKDKKDL